MFNNSSYQNKPSICNFVPGYYFYSNIGDGLAENLVNVVEGLFGFIAKIRRTFAVGRELPNRP